MKIAVTGANGYIGERFIKRALASGYEIIAYSRQRPESARCDWIPYELAADRPPDLPLDTDAVLHLATGKAPESENDSAQDLNAMEQLITAARKVNARLVFVSSQTARPDAPTAYGRSKWRIEQRVLSTEGRVVRPGQVYGGSERGLYGTLVESVRRLPVLPAFVPAPRVQPIHVDDLCDGLLRIAERNDLQSGVFHLAAPRPVSFSGFLGEIARTRLRCRRWFVPVPVIVVNAFAAIAGESLRSRLGLERLRSLFDLPVMSTAADLELLGLTLRPLRSGMHRSGHDAGRRLLLEGRSLLAYVLAAPSGSVLLRRYVRVINELRDGKALALPDFIVQWPMLLALIDGNDLGTAGANEFRWRLDAATILAEATTQGAQRFLGLGYRHGFLLSLLGMVRAVASEISWRILGILLSPVIRIALLRSQEGRS
ncbi:sugar nucleotide-binding protein [Candidatus Methylospira mobilis]|uniref:NAD-dependent epimerase/dehydratase family protein n=1 Tax=Candidatus Methylospira mobilis TaxID=1808979 RepID=UPI0028E254D6|nr:sugar nucleotide-binding protein [Candidatus Methylospira mobilis]WNV06071.1 sugar nucleotide-binding protein [Candidatus Methylospira mobilis]